MELISVGLHGVVYLRDQESDYNNLINTFITNWRGFILIQIDIC